MTTRKLTTLLGTAVLLGAGPALANGEDMMFQMMDANHDGKVTADEHATAAKDMFEKMDADHNGKVTAEEMDAFHTAMHARGGKPEKSERNEMTSVEKIKVIDTDGDGVLSAEEHAAGARSMFEKMDTDHDGNLSKSEMRAGHKKLLHKAPR